jgi:DNA-binding LytR/AlgR family response regulator
MEESLHNVTDRYKINSGKYNRSNELNFLIENYKLHLKDGTKMFEIKLSEILYIKGDGVYLRIYYTAKNYYSTLSTFDQILKKIPYSKFARCHKSYIINLMHLKKIGKTECNLTDNITIPITKTYRENIKFIDFSE